MEIIEMEGVQESSSTHMCQELGCQTNVRRKQKFKKYVSYLKFILTVFIVVLFVISSFRAAQDGGKTEALAGVLYKVLQGISSPQIGFIKSREGDTYVFGGYESITTIEPEVNISERLKVLNTEQTTNRDPGISVNPLTTAAPYDNITNDFQTN